LQAKRPGYREGTALYPCRFLAAGREPAKEAERSDFLFTANVSGTKKPPKKAAFPAVLA
jgi:hypothetical protein